MVLLRKFKANIRPIVSPLYRLIKIWKHIFITLPKKIKYKEKFVFLLITPIHSNLGDHALALSELRLLKNKYFVYEMPESELSGILRYDRYKNSLRILFGNYKLLFNAGGYIGTLWPAADDMLLNIIEHQPQNKIIILPQTVYYDDNEDGRMRIASAEKIYNEHPNLTVCTREKISYDIEKKIFDNVQLIPDMVLSLNECKNGLVRNGVIICLRNDVEKTMSDTEFEMIASAVNGIFESVIFSDMHADSFVSIKEREDVLKERFDKFRSAELIITDRLHGMIFAAVTGTPCVVFNSKSHKVRGVYDWCLSDLEYIRFADSVEDIASFYNEIKGREFKYDNSKLKPYYDRLLEIIG